MKLQEFKDIMNNDTYKKLIADLTKGSDIFCKSVQYEFSFFHESPENTPRGEEEISIYSVIVSKKSMFSFSYTNLWRNYLTALHTTQKKIDNFIMGYKLPENPTDEEKALFEITSKLAVAMNCFFDSLSHE